MKRKRPVIISILFVIIISCNNTAEKSVKEIRVSHTQIDNTFDNVIKSYEIIALDNNPEAHIRNISNIIIKDSQIYVADYDKYRIVIFDKFGNYIRSVGSKGRGPGEVVSMNDFTVNEDNSISIYDRYTVKKYSTSGELMNSDKLGFAPRSVIILKTGQIIFASNSPIGKPETDFAIRLTDNNLRSIDSRRPLQPLKNNAFVGQSKRLNSSNDHAYFFSYEADTIYHINNKSIKPAYYFSFDKKAIVGFDLSPTMYFNQGDTYYDLHYYEINDNCLLFFCHENKYYCLIFNPKTNESRVYDNSIPFVGAINNYGIVPAYAMNLEQTIKKYIDPEMKKCTNHETLSNVLENKPDDRQIIIKISLIE